MNEAIVLIVVGVICFIVVILLVRWIGAWMLRIDDVIYQLKLVNHKLEKMDNKPVESKKEKQ